MSLDASETSDEHVSQVVFKVVQRCNLNCTYCYVYNRGDDSWRRRPAVVGEEVIRALGGRIVEHCRQHGLTEFTVELHGGEPLLMGKQRMRALLDTLLEECRAVGVCFSLQTNGLLLDEEWIKLFAEYEVGFGISLDGPPAVADRLRVRHDGSGSTQAVLDVVRHLRAAGPLFDEWFGGCLCVINPECDGAEVVDWFVANGFDRFDFLLPDGHRANLPQNWTGVEPYTRFLTRAFDRWQAMGDRAPRIRKFETMMSGLMGGRVYLDSLGGDLRQLCVVESDGSIGVLDAARICGGDYAHDALNVFEHPLDRHVSRYRVALVQRACARCRACPHFRACGGGYLPHRFDGAGFDNPSLYCGALYALSERMTDLLRRELPPDVWEGADDEPVDGAPPAGEAAHAR